MKMNHQNLSTIQIITLKAMQVACYRVISQEPEQDGARYLKEWFTRQNFVLPLTRFGFDVEVTLAVREKGFRAYETWIPFSSACPPETLGVSVKEFEGGLYATLTLYHPYALNPWIARGWKELHEWVIRSDIYRSTGHQWLVEWLPEGDSEDLRLYHPVISLDKGAQHLDQERTSILHDSPVSKEVPINTGGLRWI
jgi:hypothetical protein